MVELSARLDHLHLLTDAPQRLAAFYGEALGMTPQRMGRDLWLCAGTQRRVLIGRGRSRTLGFAAYRLESQAALVVMRERLERHGIALGASRSPLFGPHAFSLTDPDGNTMIFGQCCSPQRDRSAALGARRITAARREKRQRGRSRCHRPTDMERTPITCAEIQVRGYIQ